MVRALPGRLYHAKYSEDTTENDKHFTISFKLQHQSPLSVCYGLYM